MEHSNKQGKEERHLYEQLYTTKLANPEEMDKFLEICIRTYQD